MWNMANCVTRNHISVDCALVPTERGMPSVYEGGRYLVGTKLVHNNQNELQGLAGSSYLRASSHGIVT